jgi:predicted nuclease with TOPRIM domain
MQFEASIIIRAGDHAMSNASKAAHKHAPATQKPGTKKREKKAATNLIKLDKNTAPRSQPGELNQKIDQIDADLDALKLELSTTNTGLKRSLTHLADKDLDLTSRVSEAYQQLGELDGSYKSLTDKSSRISKEIKEISKSINEINQKTDTDIGNLSEGYHLLAERTDELAQKSRLASQNLNKSIKENAKAVGVLEQSLLAEIDDLAKTSKARDDSLDEETKALGENLNRAEAEIRSSQARMLKLQTVDLALEKRADTLEATTQALAKQTGELSRSTTALNQRTSQLAEAIEALQTQTAEHSGLIANLQSRAEQTASALYALIMQEKRHFRLISGVLALLLLTLAGFLFYENSNWQEAAQANTSLQAGINSVSLDLAATEKDVASVDNRVMEVNSRVAQIDDKIHQEISTINHKLTAIGDQVGSLDGRVTNMRPYKTFGNGNVIHGPEWVSTQPANIYVIHLATVSDKQELYNLAERYSHYLKDDLAYLPVEFRGSEQFALLYGQFPTEAEATSALTRMPHYIEHQRPAIYPMSSVQSYNNNKTE